MNVKSSFLYYTCHKKFPIYKSQFLIHLHCPSNENVERSNLPNLKCAVNSLRYRGQFIASRCHRPPPRRPPSLRWHLWVPGPDSGDGEEWIVKRGRGPIKWQSWTDADWSPSSQSSPSCTCPPSSTSVSVSAPVWLAVRGRVSDQSRNFGMAGIANVKSESGGRGGEREK